MSLLPGCQPGKLRKGHDSIRQALIRIDASLYDSIPSLKATVVITTRNRKDDLRRALKSVSTQDVPVEVLVVDDCSTDGTVAMVVNEFPSIRIETSSLRQGYIVQRNRAARLAQGEVIISIDDDAEFSTPRIVRQTLAEFDHPRIAAILIPHSDVLISPRLKTPEPPGPGKWVVASYVGTTHAVKRDVFLRLGGYREALQHNTEERDFCIRLLNAGYVVCLGSADPVHHYVSPMRDAWQNRVLERRNDLLHTLLNVPWPHVLYHLPGTILNGLFFGLRSRCLPQTVQGYGKGVRACWQFRAERNPVAGNIYRLNRGLCRKRLMRLENVEKQLGPIGVDQG
jgi:glycosyltransferase involved in cell wall biosynthesis